MVACGGSSTPPTNVVMSPPVLDAGPPADHIAKSSLARDPASGIASTSLDAAVAANNAFALDLYAQLAKASGASKANLFTSPISASLALTMTYAGAKGTTATQMASALHIADASTIFDGQNALSQALASRAATAFAGAQQVASANGGAPPSTEDYQLEVINSVWGEQTYTWESPFLDVLARSYGTGVYQEDFENNPDSARNTINAWVGTQTGGKITNLLPGSAIDSATRLALVNAIHLRFPWATPFQTWDTAPATFTTAAGTTVTSPVMNRIDGYSYVDDGQAQTLALPLAGNETAMLVTLPHGDLAAYEAALTVGSPAITIPSATSSVALALPTFAFASPTFSLKDALGAMGMTQAFDSSKASFAGLCANPSDGRTLYIADVLQKTVIGVQESGVEASGATAVIVSSDGGIDFEAGAPPTPIPMIVNKPFLVSIVDRPTGAVLFLGHVEDPTNAGTP